ncbi:sulfite exporter TauE/SafE family protein, partial [Pseudorhodobacter sp.]|uniref:sulfite exporter TauE/SafE family protein n=1 Tax=Pseudorhodobacter sp. TaxID=1934400 RepID=UPI002647DCE3
RLGQIDLFVQLSYVVFLGLIGAMMLKESIGALLRARRSGAPIRRAHVHYSVHKLPLKMKFRASGLYISVIPPMLAGAAVGFLSAIMGVGGGFIMVPAMIYLLGMPTKVVVGTSLFQIIFVTAFTTVMHAVSSQTVDMVLALLLIIGGVIGAQIGSRIGVKLRAEQLRILLALMVLAVCIRIALGLLLTPDEIYSVTAGRLP